MMVDFKFDALYRYVFIESLQKSGFLEKLTGNLYWWVELCVPTLVLPHSLIIFQVVSISLRMEGCETTNFVYGA